MDYEFILILRIYILKFHIHILLITRSDYLCLEKDKTDQKIINKTFHNHREDNFYGNNLNIRKIKNFTLNKSSYQISHTIYLKK